MEMKPKEYSPADIIVEVNGKRMEGFEEVPVPTPSPSSPPLMLGKFRIPFDKIPSGGIFKVGALVRASGDIPLLLTDYPLKLSSNEMVIGVVTKITYDHFNRMCAVEYEGYIMNKDPK